MEKLVTTYELCELWNVSPKTIYNYRKLGMPHKRMGRLIRFDINEVNKWADSEKRVEN